MKKKFLSLFAALALAVTASAQLEFGKEYNQADFNDPLTTVDKYLAKWYTNDKGSDPRVRLEGNFLPVANWEKKYVTIALESGAPATLDFDYACWSALASGSLFFRIEESTDLVNWTNLKEYGKPGNLSVWHEVRGLALSEGTRYVRLTYSANYEGDYRNIKVNAINQEAKLEVVLDKAGIDFGKADSSETAVDSTFTVNWENLGNVNAFFADGENVEGIFSVDPATISTVFGNGTAQVTVSANPKGAQPGVYTANLTVQGIYSDEIDYRERIIPLKLVVTGNQAITWYDSEEDSTEVHLCVLPTPFIEPAIISTGLDLAYTTSDENIIGIDESGLPVAKDTVGTAYVTVMQEGTDIYYPAQLTRLFIVHDTTEFDTIFATICDNEPFYIGEQSWTPKQDTVIDTDTTTFYGSKMRIHANVTVNPAYTDVTDGDVICQGESYTWADTTWEATSAAGTYVVTRNLYTTELCDSIVTFTLTINPSYTDVTDEDVICQGESYTWADTTWEATSAAGTYVVTRNLYTTELCDSIVTFTLTINPIQETIETREMTYGDAFVWNGVNYATKDVDTYKDTIVLESVVTGCDSLVILDLTINKASQDIFWNLNDSNDLFIGNSLTVEAVATSGLEVTLTVTDGTAIEVDGMVVTAIAAGEATLQATAAGNKNYEDAEPIEATFTVTDITDLKLLFGNIKDAVKKVLYEGHIYIMTNGKIFNAEGVLIQ